MSEFKIWASQGNIRWLGDSSTDFTARITYNVDSGNLRLGSLGQKNAKISWSDDKLEPQLSFIRFTHEILTVLINAGSIIQRFLQCSIWTIIIIYLYSFYLYLNTFAMHVVWDVSVFSHMIFGYLLNFLAFSLVSENVFIVCF